MEPFLYVNWHNAREITVIQVAEKFQFRLQKTNENENGLDLQKPMFIELINLNWAEIMFNQLAFSQTPKDIVYIPPASEDEGLKNDSRFTTTIFHKQREFLNSF